jgi:hypothetical protein
MVDRIRCLQNKRTIARLFMIPVLQISITVKCRIPSRNKVKIQEAAKMPRI